MPRPHFAPTWFKSIPDAPSKWPSRGGERKIGIEAVKGSYAGRVRLSDKHPPDRFTMHLEGKGAAGFVNGTARIELEEEGRNTQLHYNADVQVGGLIAAVGSRMIEAAAKKL